MLAAYYAVERTPAVREALDTLIDMTLAWQAAFAKSDNRWVSGWNGNPQLLEVRLGAHYYYNVRKPKPKSSKPGLGG